jgi:signal transduction histidine kinase/DNA-binding response OmpR family regulator
MKLPFKAASPAIKARRARRLIVLTALSLIAVIVGIIHFQYRQIESLNQSLHAKDDNALGAYLHFEIDFMELARLVERGVAQPGKAGRDEIQLRYDVFVSRMEPLLVGHYLSLLQDRPLYTETVLQVTEFITVADHYLGPHADKALSTTAMRMLHERLGQLRQPIRDLSLAAVESTGNYVVARNHQIRRQIIIGTALTAFECLLTVLLVIALVRQARQREKAQMDSFAAQEMTLITQNHLVDALRENEEKLEARVEQRTQELAAVNQVLRDHEAELVLAREAAVSASVAKSLFLANMSHEIRTPMNGVMGMLKLLRHTELTSRQLDYTTKAQTAAQSLLGIINDILDFSKVEAGKMTLDAHGFLIDRLMRDASAIVSINLKSKDVEILFSIDPGIDDALVGDALRLKQIMLNLTNNAVKFTESGEIVVALKLLSEDASTCTIEFSIKDSGIGIPAAKLQTIFEGFSQADASTTRRYGGTGLGLAISRRLVELMGGTLQVESQPGQGSRFFFTVCFEKSREQAQTGSHPAGQGVVEEARVFRVLIADDNDTSRDLLCKMAAPFGWKIDSVNSGYRALSYAQQSLDRGSPYHAIFIDWLMPGMDGWEAVSHIRRLVWGDTPPVIILLASHSPEILTKRMQDEPYAMDGLLVKPVTASMLLDAVMDATEGMKTLGQRRIAEVGSARLAGLNLLVVDDNQFNQQIASELLASEGAHITIAGGGVEAVRLAASAQPRFDAVLMDIQMPDLDGYEATQQILAHPHLTTMPIIAMTANAMESDKVACLAAGMVGHVGKPIDLEILVATIRQHCETPAAPPPSEAPPPEPAAEEKIGEIDLEQALRRIGGKRALYAELMRSFRRQGQAMLDELRQFLAQDERTGSLRVAHTLKGMAGSIGAHRLADSADRIERSLKQGESPTAQDSLLTELEARMQDALAALENLAAEFGATDTPVPTATSSAPPDKTALLALLAELDTQLEGRKMKATRVFADFKHQAGGNFESFLTPIEEALNQLNFQLALQHCQHLREELT